jgi:hypothetical protein
VTEVGASKKRAALSGRAFQSDIEELLYSVLTAKLNLERSNSDLDISSGNVNWGNVVIAKI